MEANVLLLHLLHLLVLSQAILTGVISTCNITGLACETTPLIRLLKLAEYNNTTVNDVHSVD